MLLKGEVRTYCKYYTAQPASPMPPRDGTGWLSSPTLERTQRPSQQLTNPSSPAFRVYRESWEFPRKRISRATLHNKSRSNRAGEQATGYLGFVILRFSDAMLMTMRYARTANTTQLSQPALRLLETALLATAAQQLSGHSCQHNN